MPWIKIDKNIALKAVKKPHYTHWKALLAEEGKHQCVYCTIHDGQFGGYRNFAVEHYKPKKKFPSETDSYLNLFYACSICNSFKGESWVDDATTAMNKEGFINPSMADYNEIFTIDTDFALTAKKVAPKYMIECVFLNRPQLLYLRRKEILHARFKAAVDQIASTVSGSSDASLWRSIAKCMSSINKILVEMDHTSPYTPEEIKRPKTIKKLKRIRH